MQQAGSLRSAAVSRESVQLRRHARVFENLQKPRLGRQSPTGDLVLTGHGLVFAASIELLD